MDHVFNALTAKNKATVIFSKLIIKIKILVININKYITVLNTTRLLKIVITLNKIKKLNNKVVIEKIIN